MNQTIYFQKAIWDKFKDEPNKSQVINELLKSHYDPIDVVAQLKEVDLKPTSGSAALPLMRACCVAKTRCVHWQWNELDENYVNTLTGEVRNDEAL